MRVKNMKSYKGNYVPNQFIISRAVISLPDDTYTGEAFQSYDNIIALKAFECCNTGNCYRVFLDRRFWNYSRATGKYRNQFLGETKKKTDKKIKSGEYKLADLNK